MSLQPHQNEIYFSTIYVFMGAIQANNYNQQKKAQIKLKTPQIS